MKLFLSFFPILLASNLTFANTVEYGYCRSKSQPWVETHVVEGLNFIDISFLDSAFVAKVDILICKEEKNPQSCHNYGFFHQLDPYKISNLQQMIKEGKKLSDFPAMTYVGLVNDKAIKIELDPGSNTFSVPELKIDIQDFFCSRYN